MNEMQAKLVDMLAWFHDMCEKNKLRYYIIAGTMLGAVRHGGFIPWDDDIDVGMPRADYEKLRELVKKEQDERYFIEYPGLDNKEYTYLTAKVYDTRTTLIEKRRKPIKRGIYIDIFPLDGIGNTKEEAVENYKPFKFHFNFQLIITVAFLKRRSLAKNAVTLMGRIISPLFVKDYKHLKKLDDICKRIDFDDAKIVSNLMGGSGVKGMVPVEYFGKPTPVRFETLTVYGLENADAYLSSMYGDYMKLPPVEKQVSLHDSIECDLNKSYLKD